MTLPRNRRELEDLLRAQEDVDRRSTVRAFDGKASELGHLFTRDQVELFGEQGRHSIDYIGVTTCDFGHVLGPERNLVATCYCGKMVCEHPTCSHVCKLGNHVVCPRHAVLIKGETYCHRHVPAFISKRVLSGAFSVARSLGWLVISNLFELDRCGNNQGRRAGKS